MGVLRWCARHWMFTIVMILVLVLAYFAQSGIYAYATARKEVVTLRSFDTKLSTGGAPCLQKYLVFTDKGEFENTDSSWRNKWNSSHVQNELKNLQGKQVVLHYYGWRVPFYSWYPNIIGFTPYVPESTAPYTPYNRQ